MSVETAIPALGQKIAERYVVEQPLGQGGMGVVYVARDAVLGRRVALKVMWPRFAIDDDSQARFQREARVACALTHPNAVKIHDFGHSGDLLYMAMELLQGQSLHDALDDWEDIDCARVSEIGYHVADVLAAAHEISLIHRDIKPDNIFLDRTNGVERVVVLDFGLAFVLDSEDDSVGRLTTDNAVMGTPNYMSPEQACNVALGPASDIYSLGCVLFEMACGRPPYRDRAVAKVLSKHMYAPIPSVRQYNPDAPAALHELLARMLAKRPEERPSATQVRQRLAAFQPGALDVRSRNRDASYLSDREARMVSQPTARETSPGGGAPGDIHLAILGPCDPELPLALASNAIRVARVAQLQEALAGFDVIFVTAGAGADLSAAVRAGVPVLAESAAGDMRRITELLRAGVAEVVLQPLAVDELARKAKRAHRKSRNSRRRGNRS